MKKFVRICGIITTSMIATQNMFQLISKDSALYTFVNKYLTPIVTSMIYNIIILILCTIILVTMIYDILHENKTHCFTVGSPRFCTFFSKWYSQTGLLSIFCDDLEGWVISENNQKIYNALRQKSRAKQLRLFLGRQIPSDIVDEFRSLGADVHAAPNDIITNYSFSCLSIMGNNSAVIIRNKQKDKAQKIIFVEISDTYVSGLLNALIKENI